MKKSFLIFLIFLFVGYIYSTGMYEKMVNYYWQVDRREEFFKTVVGVAENQFLKFSDDQIRSLFFFDVSRNSYIIKNVKTGKEYQAGIFQTQSISDLRKKTEHLQNAQRQGTFNVVAARNPSNNLSLQQTVEVAALQADPKNNDAVFQVASNFNALEPISVSTTPESGITIYVDDHTQGPAAVISAAPGIIMREYFIFYDNNPNPHIWRQTKDHQLNLLEDVQNYFPVKNGYVVLSQESLQNSVSEALVQNMKIGFHKDIQVVFAGQSGKESHLINKNATQRIHQVFAAGLDLGSASGSGNRKFLYGEYKDEVVKRAQMLLDAAYEGAIKVTAAHGKKKLFLTLVGGGVFDNNLAWIAQSLEKNVDFIKRSGIDVTLIIYNLTSIESKVGFGELNGLLKRMVAATSGTYSLYQ